MKNDVFNIVSKYEAMVANEIHKYDNHIDVRFTTFGNRAACNLLYDTLMLLDSENQNKIINTLKK